MVATEACAEILQDLEAMVAQVQHPVRGLFLRYFLLQMVKDKLRLPPEEALPLKVTQRSTSLTSCTYIQTNIHTYIYVRMISSTYEYHITIPVYARLRLIYSI